MIEVVIDSIRVSLISQQRVVMLRDADGENQLPIYIGPCEADAITIELQDHELARPMTHDLLNNVITDMGGTVAHILINELRDQIFHASLHIKVDGEVTTIDCRPSDAIAIAVRARVPIYIADEVWDDAAISLEPDISEVVPTEDAVDSAENDPSTEVELDAFRDFLDNLDED